MALIIVKLKKFRTRTFLELTVWQTNKQKLSNWARTQQKLQKQYFHFFIFKNNFYISDLNLQQKGNI